jgi:hypothetical protein
MTDTRPEDLPTRPFADWLREQASGSTHEELSQALRDVIAKVRDTGKKGSLTFTVNVSTLKDDNNVLVVTDEIKTKLPEHDRSGSIFWADKAGNLTRSDPRQLSFESLREVPAPTINDADVDQTTGEIKDAHA